MGVETNPQKVDDLNELWPAKGEPVKEGYRHLQNIKKAAKARANTAGVYGVTTLEDGVDVDSSAKAATAKAVKTVNDKTIVNAEAITGLTEALGDLDTSVGEAAVPVNGLWTVEAGNAVSFNWKQSYTNAYFFRVGSNDVILAPVYYLANNQTNWMQMAAFSAFNSGVFRFKPKFAFRVFFIGAQLQYRLLKNGTVVWSETETSATAEGKFGAGGQGTFEYSEDIECTAGDFFEFEVRSAGSANVSGFRFAELTLSTVAKPFLTSMALGGMAYYNIVGSSGVEDQLGVVDMKESTPSPTAGG